MKIELVVFIITIPCIAAVAAFFVICFQLVRKKKRVGRCPEATQPPLFVATESGPRGISGHQTIVDSITDGICIIDRRFHICLANKSYGEMVRKPVTEVVGGICYRVFRGRDTPCEECPAKAALAEGKPVVRKNAAQRACDGQRRLEISVYPVFDDKKGVSHIIEYIRDMTEDAAILDRLIRSEKIAGIGVMTTGIAHEMNNALSGIAGTASNLLTMPEKYGLNEKAVNRVISILDAATRATEVMKNLLHFSNPLREETHVMINLRQLVKRVMDSIALQESPDIERRLTFDDSLPPVRADLSKIELVLVNVVSNAIRSIQEKKSRSFKQNEPYKGSLVVSVGLHRDSALVTVTDNGVGIPENIRSKIFDPFFSSWPHGKGTGLGLSTAFHIADEHGGRIFFESNNGLTTFSILLPIDRRRCIAPSPPGVGK